jgi:hypothetical protein
MMKRLAIATLLATLALVGASDVSAAGATVQVKLKASPGAMFLVAKPPRLVLSPVRVTLGLWRGGVFHSRILGMRPGGVIFAGVKAKPFHLHVRGPGLHVGPGKGPPIKLHPGRGPGPKIRIKF